jgi:hypothetical protein
MHDDDSPAVLAAAVAKGALVGALLAEILNHLVRLIR